MLNNSLFLKGDVPAPNIQHHQNHVSIWMLMTLITKITAEMQNSKICFDFSKISCYE